MWWQSNADADSYSYTNANSDAYSNTDADSNSDTNTSAYSDTNADSNACAGAERAVEPRWDCRVDDSDQSVVD